MISAACESWWRSRTCPERRRLLAYAHRLMCVWRGTHAGMEFIYEHRHMPGVEKLLVIDDPTDHRFPSLFDPDDEGG